MNPVSISTQHPDILYIDSEDALAHLCAQLATAPYLAVDTEFIREKTYFARLCLIQVATDDIIACIDPLNIPKLDCLLDLFFDPNIVKIFHAARQDLELFYDLTGKLPAPVFDTQIAATLLGQNDQCGYGNLVKSILDIELEKGQARTDWSQRPLDEAQIHYAADDVRYLVRLYPIIVDALKEQQRLDWLDDDFAALQDPALYESHPEQAWKRVGGHNRLKGVQLAILKQLAAWREQQARQRNRPRKWILNDDALSTLARIAPTNPAELEKIRGLPPQVIQRDGEALLAQIKKGQNLPKEQWPVVKFKRLNLYQDSLTDILMAVLKIQCDRHNITPAIIASRKDLEKLAMGDRELPVLQGWRKHIAGDTLLELIDGRLVIEVVDQRITLKVARDD